MRDTILSTLSEIQDSENIQIVYACESGSRAWGFPSSDSDYDVRFIYVHPISWYLSIDEKRSVIERPISDNLDINGWDLRKALQLFRKSNPPLLEWLGSPIVYLEKFSVTAKLRKLAPTYYSPKACLYHYLHMANSNYRAYLKGDVVWIKKYFYVLRPLLAMTWIEKELGVVPTSFLTLVSQLVPESILKNDIDQLLAAKRSGAELDRGPRIPSISEFIEREIARWEQQGIEDQSQPQISGRVDELFRESLSEIWQIGVV
jgi:predicted nucleotidyltransferase